VLTIKFIGVYLIDQLDSD